MTDADFFDVRMTDSPGVPSPRGSSTSSVHFINSEHTVAAAGKGPGSAGGSGEPDPPKAHKMRKRAAPSVQSQSAMEWSDIGGDTPTKHSQRKRHKGGYDDKSAGGGGGSTSFSSSAGAGAAASPSAPSSESESELPSGGNTPLPGTTSAYEERAHRDRG
eukprot:g923.t1